MRLADVRKDFKLHKMVYLILAPVIIYFIVFNYIPMAGIVLAFEKFETKMGIFGSPWIGFKNFTDFFGSYYFWRLIRNTFLISFYDFAWGFPAPIILALMLNEIGQKTFKKVVQTISYMPFFISMVVIAGLIIDFTSSTGTITSLVAALGGQKENLLSRPELFRTIFVASNIWQNIGFQSIIFLAALSGIDQELYQAARIDGAGRWKQTLHVTLPGIAGTIIIMMILRIGNMMNVGMEKVILLYNPLTYETADVISSFTYRKGLQEFNYGYSTAVGLFNSVINFGLLLVANAISRKFSESSLF
ncbi:MAG: sugar ABC transporter permease [Clostridiales bacterium]|nr:sugar ABC transporter permease [Clostridiales bacterium]